MLTAGILVLLSSTVAMAAGTQTIEGRWTGSYRMANTWRFITLDLEPGTAPGGALQVPADGETLAVGSLQWSGGKLRFRAGPEGDVTEFEGVVAADRISGDLSYPDGKGRFQMLRSQPPTDSLWRDYPGHYSIPGGDYLGVVPYDPGNREPHLVYLDSKSGEWGILVPVQREEFAVLPARVLPFTTSTRLTFIRDGASVSGVRLTRGRSHVQGRKDAAIDAEEVRFRNGSIDLVGTLLTPAGATGRIPAVVIVHGSGAQTRNGSPSSPSYLRLMGEHFARAGCAALIYDKRGTGGSTGNWRTAGFDDLAQDVLSAVGFLQGRPGIDPLRIGVWGISEAGWVISSVVSRPSAVAFVIVVGGGGLSPANQELYGRELNLKEAGFSEREIQRALTHQRLKFDLVRANDAAGLDRANEAARNERWFNFVSNPTSAEESWRYWRSVIDFDPRANWARYRGPMLVVFGADDESGPSGPSLASIQSARSKGEGPPMDSKVFSGADHMLIVRPRESPAHLAPGYLSLMSDWLQQAARRTAPTPR